MASALQCAQAFFPHVTRVKDATRSITVTVTQRDLKGAKNKEHDHCALAVACQRQFHLTGAVISRSTAYLIKGAVATRYTVPPYVRQNIITFDKGGPFDLGPFQLWKPQHPMGRKDGGNAPRRKSKRLLKTPAHFLSGVRASLSSGLKPPAVA